MSDWEKVENIFHNALAIPLGEREEFLQSECADDAELRKDVESLLDSYENKAAFLDKPVFEIGLGALGEAGQKNLAGTEIGNYRLEEKIGAGGMGEVYAALDTSLNRRVALKFLPPSMEDDLVARRRLVKEAQAAAALTHQNICAVHSVEEIDGQNFIVMQYIEGKTLDIARNGDKISVEDFKSLARQILTAVAFAHSHGVVHRDLKPGNIMLTNDGEIKVLDFGLAKIMPTNSALNGKSNNETNFSQNGLVIGTVAYMSPEQLRGEKLDYQTDIFSVGIILYELITGKSPFNRPSQAETVAAILSEKAVPLGESAPDFPKSLIRLVEKCLEKDAKQRFQSAAEILVELDNSKNEDYRVVSSKNRARFFLKSALATVLILIFFATGIFLYNSRYSQRTLAVLPIKFENPSSDKEYLADGLTQSLIDKLSNLSDLKVKNEFFIARYRGKKVEPQVAGRELNVDAVSSGEIIKINDSIILRTKLVRTSDGFEIDSFDEEINEANLIELQENVSRRIISKIKSNMTDDDNNRLAKKDTENPEAKKLYIRGRFLLERQEGDDLKNAARLFKQATNLDSSYAKAYTGLADTYALFSVPGHKGAGSPEEAVKSARAAAKKAMEIDDNLCEPHVSLGMISLRYDWDWNEAERHFKDAIIRNPEFPQAHLGLSNLLIIKKDYAGSIESAKKAREFSPFSVLPYLSLTRSYYFERNYEQMDKTLNEAFNDFPNHKRLRYFRGLQYLATNRLKEAANIFEILYQEDKIYGAAPLALAYGRAGRKDEALKILGVLEELSKKENSDYVAPQEIAITYLGLGDRNKVFEYLSKSCGEKYPAFPFVVTDPIFDELKSDARFAGIIECAKL